jgi:16S rRNA (guanine527-N7)-methyltransferase
MTAQPRTILQQGLEALGLEASATQCDQMMALLDLVAEWNQKINLTAITEPVAMVQKHLLDSLTVQPWIKGPFVIDVGTGAGFPGLPLAILNPNLRFTLLDSTGKKIRFVEHVIQSVGLPEVTAVCARAEHFKPEQRAATVVSRALSTVPEFIRYAGHMVSKSGTLLAMKGKDPAAELVNLAPQWRLLGVERLTVPGLSDQRHVARLARVVLDPSM